MGDYRFSRRRFSCGTLLARAVQRAGFGSQPSLKAVGLHVTRRDVEHRLHSLGTTGLRRLLRAASSGDIVAPRGVDDNRRVGTRVPYPGANEHSDDRQEANEGLGPDVRKGRELALH